MCEMMHVHEIWAQVQSVGRSNGYLGQDPGLEEMHEARWITPSRAPFKKEKLCSSAAQMCGFFWFSGRERELQIFVEPTGGRKAPIRPAEGTSGPVTVPTRW